MQPNRSRDGLVSLVFISKISFLSLAEKINLLKNLDSSSTLALMSLNDFKRFAERPLRVKSFDGKKTYEESCAAVRMMEMKGIGLSFYGDSDYPAILRETSNAPFVLYYRGNFESLLEKSVSVVGTRLMSPDGKLAAYRFSYDAVMDGCCVVSGLARGVDGEAHRGAVDAAFDIFERTGSFSAAKTIAVLPCGIDTVVPSGHKRLSENIIRTGGCLVSEYAPGTPSEAFRFVQRNRIIAALSAATVVVQAPDGSGALITADFALEYNRDLVFHEACFSEGASSIRNDVRSRRQKELSLGKISSAKAERTVEGFLRQGAPVVHDYRDYVKCLSEPPGTRCVKNQQFMLF